MKEKIQEDIKVAMKASRKDDVITLRGLLSEIKRLEIDTRTALTDEQCIGVLQKEIKKRRDAIEFAKKANRGDLVEKNEAEIALIQRYLGEQLGEGQLKELVAKLIAQGASSVGQVMASLNKDYKGKFEGKLASEIIREQLGAN
ncbi:MAG: GatB/YqeY domain-containing protein [Deltaproteobacteria bacterium]|nr:GatB/YqeY domain-containing protein [Deltaproteobacteria bacterium]